MKETSMQDRPLEELLAHAIESTQVIRHPKQHLATFVITSIKYYLVTEAAYNSLNIGEKNDDVVIREGMVRAEQPQVVTPQYLLNHEGFGDYAGEYLRHLRSQGAGDTPGLLYAYKNEGMRTNIASGDVKQVAYRLKGWLDREERGMEAVIQGIDELWDVSLMKFIYDLTSASLRANLKEIHNQGLFDVERGIPRAARERIEELLTEARQGNVDPAAVHQEIERWGAVDEYQDKFLAIFKRK